MGEIRTRLLIVVSVERNVTSQGSGFEIGLSNCSRLWGCGLSLIVYYLALGWSGQRSSGLERESLIKEVTGVQLQGLVCM